MVGRPKQPSQTNMEPSLASFVGREAETSAIAAHFARGAGLVALWGAGGIGKTRLAREFCWKKGGRFRRADAGGVWFCDLSSARTDGDLAAAVAQVMELSLPPGGSDPLSALAQAMSSLPGAMLVLDNADLLVSVHAEAMARLARPHTKHRILVTTRTMPERVWDDFAVEIGPLAVEGEPGGEQDVPDAVALFVERTRLHRPGYAPHDSELDRIRQLTGSLGGTPLAIELAAARMDVLDLEDLAERLSNGLGALVPTGLAGQRQVALTSAIEASWEMLSETEQRFLTQCAIFKGGFAFAAVKNIVRVPDDEDAALLLGGLRRKSLLMVQRDGEDGSSRRFQLHESVREFCSERMAGTRLGREVALRHSRYFGDQAGVWAKDLLGPSGTDTLALLAQEVHNVRGVVERWLADGDAEPALFRPALSAAAALEPHYLARGPLQSFADLLVELLDSLSAGERAAADVAHLRLSLGRVCRSLGKVTEARAHLEEAARLTEQSPLSLPRCEAHIELGLLHHHERRLDEARACYGEALEVRQALAAGAEAEVPEAWHAHARILGNLGAVEHDLGHWDAAIEAYQQSLGLFRRVGHRRHEGIFLTNLALAQQEVGANERAMETYEQALRLLEVGGDWRFLGIALTNQGWLLLSVGDAAAAQQLQLRARQMLRRLGERRSESLCLSRLGATQCALGKLDEARGSFDEADRVIAPLDDSLVLALLRLHRGFLTLELSRQHQQRGDAELARNYRSNVADLVAQVREPCDGGPSIHDRSDDARLAVRMLDQLLQATVPAPERDDALLVGPDATWFRGPSEEPRDLRRHGVIRKLLSGLVEHRRAHPGGALSMDDLFSTGWPGQRATPNAQANRVYVAVATLKKLGLRSCLERRDDGYLLRPDVEVLDIQTPFTQLEVDPPAGAKR